jgi:hypothetical protein
MVSHDMTQAMDETAGAGATRDRSGPDIQNAPLPEPTLADVIAAFGDTHQITVEEFCIVAVRRPSPTVQVVTIGRTAGELLAKLRAGQDGTS